jgi:hypothetical protein
MPSQVKCTLRFILQTVLTTMSPSLAALELSFIRAAMVLLPSNVWFLADRLHVVASSGKETF